MAALAAMPSKRRLDLHYIALQAGFWAAFAAICAYQAALLQGRGFTNTQVGVVMAVRCLAGVVAQPLLGSWADKHPKLPLKWVVCVCLAVSFFAGLVLLYPLSMAGTLVVFALLGALEISAYPLMDAMAVQFIHAGVDLSYSIGRGIGSFAYAVCCVLLGFQSARFGVESTLRTHSALVLVLMAITATFPTFRPQWSMVRGEREETPRSALALLREDPRFTLMLFGILLGLTGVLPMSNFLINVIRDRGGSEAQLGVALFLMAAAELPAAFLFTRLYRRRGRAAGILVASMGFMALKCGLFLVARNYWAIWAIQPLQMLGYGLFTPASVYYVSDVIPTVDQVKGQTLMMVASNGLGGVLEGIIAGGALDAWGVDPMLALCGGLCTAAGVVCALSAYAGVNKG